ncbi:hypothetical protein BC937DRAFT_87847 [Endogone sp. FLAS-F59071]|nr:hypothetical protein BC937DRAFT_87847 [Endogone sp. FLAS-F59071]|eukprot:RUS12454.1 hypothetical protein BC937DRAFT_87847 [Endogone sp. FLAS-F59071]
MYDPHSRESRGFAFIRMDTNDDAVRAIEGANGSELNGRNMSVEKAKRGRPRTPTPGRYYGPPKRRGEEGSPPSLFYQLYSFVPSSIAMDIFSY